MRKTTIITMTVIILIAISVISYGKYVLERNNVAANLDIDRTKPVAAVEYSTTDMTNEYVDVIVKLSEPIQEVDGWNLSEDKLTLTKRYEQNEVEDLKIVDLSNNENMVNINVANIDKDAPVINLVNVQNTNKSYESYANKTHTITATIKITDYKMQAKIDASKIDVYVGGEKSNCSKKIDILSNTDAEVIFTLVLSNIESNGDLKIVIPNGFVTDLAQNTSKEASFDLNIKIDNIKPQGMYSQQILSNGKVEATITSNEKIRPLNEWNQNPEKTDLKKTFPANVSYIVTIMDFAENTAEVEVNVTGATYIVLTYASHNSDVGWTYGMGNYDIAGATAVKKSSRLKTEALAFNISGGVNKNFVKAKGYVNSFWNNLTEYGKCKSTGYKYKLGQTPYYTMASSNLSVLNGKSYIQIGGSGINQVGNTDYNGNNPIPYGAIYNSRGGYPYGVSAIEISLQDYSELSVVYQILVKDKGWLKPECNGSVAQSSINEPMSAIRVAIIPNSELQSIISLWSKDNGTNNVN